MPEATSTIKPMPDPSNAESLSIAIIGAGITGTVLALGLTNRPFPIPVTVQIYEQSSTLHAPGAGIAFTANARKCLSLINSALEDCVTRVGTRNGEDPERPNDYMQFVDGYTWDRTKGAGIKVGQDLAGKKVYRLHAGRRGFEGCHRQEFLEGVLKELRGGVVVLGKRVESVLPDQDQDQDQGGSRDGGKTQLVFSDGSRAEADVGTSALS
ncbi:FAD-dependent oxidoreductase [Aspergillus mulundensis]|uniref:FAD-dependent urate hydroxylase HpyO/Asp monooxygenase CreE-like FAD/NAD(P)-binding domain-containing protein n=1 Tax=Aspergillus mulundensis TaxID=1810919 RepID=A0A3D8SLN1_9EURO|nr:hypothetical protein DSM5745_03746 [Aspergillus mulundensis]RDW87104.1 hypothetical protein DSM5745_03746 [Aspergillus mulundensis]